MEMTNTGDLSIEKPRVFRTVEAGTWEAEYKGFRPYKEDGQWGHKEGVRLQFRVTKGPYANEYVAFKGAFYQDQATGKYIIGRKSKLAEAIRNVTGGAESLNKGHEGTIVFVTVAVNPSKKDPNVRYSNVTAIIPIPKDYAAAAPAQAARPPMVQAPQAPAPTPAPAAAPVQAAAQTAPGQAQMQATQPAAQTQPAPEQAKNKDLLDELSDLSDFGS